MNIPNIILPSIPSMSSLPGTSPGGWPLSQTTPNTAALPTFPSVTDATGMFSDMPSLATVPSVGVMFPNLTSAKDMFKDSTNITAVDLSELPSSLTDMSGMLSGLPNLTTVTGLDTANTSGVTNMSGLFQGASSLTTLDMGGLNTSNVTDATNMFNGTTALTTLDNFANQNFNSLPESGFNSMFADSGMLNQPLDVGNWSTDLVQNTTGPADIAGPGTVAPNEWVEPLDWDGGGTLVPPTLTYNSADKALYMSNYTHPNYGGRYIDWRRGDELHDNQPPYAPTRLPLDYKPYWTVEVTHNGQTKTFLATTGYGNGNGSTQNFLPARFDTVNDGATNFKIIPANYTISPGHEYSGTDTYADYLAKEVHVYLKSEPADVRANLEASRDAGADTSGLMDLLVRGTYDSATGTWPVVPLEFNKKFKYLGHGTTTRQEMDAMLPADGNTNVTVTIKIHDASSFNQPSIEVQSTQIKASEWLEMLTASTYDGAQDQTGALGYLDSINSGELHAITNNTFFRNQYGGGLNIKQWLGQTNKSLRIYHPDTPLASDGISEAWTISHLPGLIAGDYDTNYTSSAGDSFNWCGVNVFEVLLKSINELNDNNNEGIFRKLVGYRPQTRDLSTGETNYLDPFIYSEILDSCLLPEYTIQGVPMNHIVDTYGSVNYYTGGLNIGVNRYIYDNAITTTKMINRAHGTVPNYLYDAASSAGGCVVEVPTTAPAGKEFELTMTRSNKYGTLTSTPFKYKSWVESHDIKDTSVESDSVNYVEFTYSDNTDNTIIVPAFGTYSETRFQNASYRNHGYLYDFDPDGTSGLSNDQRFYTNIVSTGDNTDGLTEYDTGAVTTLPHVPTNIKPLDVFQYKPEMWDVIRSSVPSGLYNGNSIARWYYPVDEEQFSSPGVANPNYGQPETPRTTAQSLELWPDSATKMADFVSKWGVNNPYYSGAITLTSDTSQVGNSSNPIAVDTGGEVMYQYPPSATGQKKVRIYSRANFAHRGSYNGYLTAFELFEWVYPSSGFAQWVNRQNYTFPMPTTHESDGEAYSTSRRDPRLSYYWMTAKFPAEITNGGIGITNPWYRPDSQMQKYWWDSIISIDISNTPTGSVSIPSGHGYTVIE